MCATYGFGCGPRDLGLTFDLPPMHEPDSRRLLAEWAREQRGTARITGSRARNLNPIIHAQTGERSIELGWWWLHHGSGPAPYSAFNSRDDALLAKWRGPFQRRAIIPAHWYVEKGSTCALPNDELFGIAAILAPIPRPGEAPMLSYSVVTRAAVSRAADVHSRMPLMLPREVHDAWMDPRRPGSAGLVAAAVRASEDLAAAVEVIDEAPELEPEAPTLF